MELQVLKGMKDVLPSESVKWQYVEGVMRSVCAKHGFNETRTPLLEHTGLFLRGVGATTDIVQKEMYTFIDKGDRSVTLRPEGTAGVARMFVENKLYAQAQPLKMYYLSAPVFRYERPQAGRLREHHQFGVEFYGAKSSAADAECIALVFEVLSALGIGSLRVNINSIGCGECRPLFNSSLREYLGDSLEQLCDNCSTRYAVNPMRILDCKEEKCKAVCNNAPRAIDFLCDDCRAHFDGLKTRLDVLNIPYDVNPSIVRGLDYYTKTVFEVVSDSIGAQNAICGGGRYDNLVAEIGGPATPAVGFGMGMERLLLMLGTEGVYLPACPPVDVYIASMGDAPGIAAMRLAYELRNAGVCCEFDYMNRSFKAQFKHADKLGARLTVIIGESELESGRYSIKSMADGLQTDVEAARTVELIQEMLK